MPKQSSLDRHGDIPSLAAELLSVLTTAQRQRPKRPAFNIRGEPEWASFERATMLHAVNEARSRRHLPPLPEATIKRAENLALGHSDYSSKFALHCAELVAFTQPDKPPR